jgi:hypothetical protein
VKTRLLAMALALVFLTGCASILDREYNTVEPHSSKFWESEAVDTLRAENYQDLVNDLLILIGRHKESAAIRLYNFDDEVIVAETVERAMGEVQQETPLGSYAVEYIASATQAQRGYYEISLRIGYRRTAEQIQGLMNATSAEAIYSLMESALNAGRTELAVRIIYWGADSRATVEGAVAQLREERGLTETPEWLVRYHPSAGAVGLVEIITQPTEKDLAETEQTLTEEEKSREPASGREQPESESAVSAADAEGT